MLRDLAKEYLERADRCRQQAGDASDPLNKERWLKFAEQWSILARDSAIAANHQNPT
jgi:hypothetical protein